MNESFVNLSVVDQDVCNEISSVTGTPQMTDVLSDARQCLFDNGFDDSHEYSSIPEEDTESYFDDLIHGMFLGGADTGDNIDIQDGFMGFDITKSPPILTRHPRPESGKDEDYDKCKEILDKVFLRSGQQKDSKERIILAPDNKIAKNIIQLMKNDPKYEKFFLTFPLLHWRKSKIGSIGSTFALMGIVDIVKYMIDNDIHTEWDKLVGLSEINFATKFIRRLSQALHISFMIKFMEWLPPDDASQLRADFKNGKLDPCDLSSKWHDQYDTFMEQSANQNGTFALHRDLLIHLDEVVSLYMAERLGGTQGYSLVLGVAKQSLPFAFVAGTAAYAPMVTELLHQHSKASPFHKRAVASLFSISHQGSEANFALDAIRELEHKDAVKGFRPRADADSAINRMSLVDTFMDINASRNRAEDERTRSTAAEDKLRLRFSQSDSLHIVRAASLFLRRGGISNVYKILCIYSVFMKIVFVK